MATKFKYIGKNEKGQFLYSAPDNRIGTLAMLKTQPKKQDGIITSVAKGITQPFVNLGRGSLELANYATSKLQGNDFQRMYLSEQEAASPFTFGLKTAAGVGSFLVPGLGASGTLLNLGTRGALGGALSAYGSGMDVSEDSILKGAALGGGLGVGLGLAGRAIKKLSGKTLEQVDDAFTKEAGRLRKLGYTSDEITAAIGDSPWNRRLNLLSSNTDEGIAAQLKANQGLNLTPRDTSKLAKDMLNRGKPGDIPKFGEKILADVAENTDAGVSKNVIKRQAQKLLYKDLGAQYIPTKQGGGLAFAKTFEKDMDTLDEALKRFDLPRNTKSLGGDLVERIGALRENSIFTNKFNTTTGSLIDSTSDNIATSAGLTKSEATAALSNKVNQVLNRRLPTGEAGLRQLTSNKVPLNQFELHELVQKTQEAAFKIADQIDNGTFWTKPSTKILDDMTTLSVHDWARGLLGAKIPDYNYANKVFASLYRMNKGFVSSANQGLLAPGVSTRDVLTAAGRGVQRKGAQVAERVGNILPVSALRNPVIQRLASDQGLTNLTRFGAAYGGSRQPNSYQDTYMTPPSTQENYQTSTFGGGADPQRQKLEAFALAYSMTGNVSQALQLANFLGASEKSQPTEKQQAFGRAASSARNALNLLESGQAGTGKIQTVKSAVGGFLGTLSPTQTEYKSQLALARSMLMNSMAGANVTPSEAKRLADAIPNETDEPAIAKQKLQTFIQELEQFSQPTSYTGLYGF